MISAPIPGLYRAANALSTPTLPPGWLPISWKKRVSNIPLVQPLAGVPERGLEALTLAGGEAVERDRQIVDADLGHR